VKVFGEKVVATGADSTALVDGSAVKSEPNRRPPCAPSSQVSEFCSGIRASFHGCNAGKMVLNHLVQRGPVGLGIGTRTSNEFGVS